MCTEASSVDLSAGIIIAKAIEECDKIIIFLQQAAASMMDDYIGLEISGLEIKEVAKVKSTTACF